MYHSDTHDRIKMSYLSRHDDVGHVALLRLQRAMSSPITLCARHFSRRRTFAKILKSPLKRYAAKHPVVLGHGTFPIERHFPCVPSLHNTQKSPLARGSKMRLLREGPFDAK